MQGLLRTHISDAGRTQRRDSEGNSLSRWRVRMIVVVREEPYKESLMEIAGEKQPDEEPAAVSIMEEEAHSAHGLEADVHGEYVQESAMEEIDAASPSPSRCESASSMYSLVLSKSYYYTVAQQFQIGPCTDIQQVIAPSDRVNFYAFPVRYNFPSYVATLANLSCGSLLYICIYNPMTDPPLSAMRELLLSAQKERPIFLVVILPLLDTLTAALRGSSLMRLQTAHCTQFVTTMCDLEDMLMKASTGIISQLAFVVPVDDFDRKTLRANEVWKSATKIFGTDQCIAAAVSQRAPG